MLVFSIILAQSLVALSLPHSHQDSSEKCLPSTWYHRDDHPVHRLFRRDATTDGENFPAVASAAWNSSFQPGENGRLTPEQLPASWYQLLNASVASGAIPNIPPSTQPQGPGTNPVYAGLSPTGPEVCSSTYQCRGTGTIWDAPDGVMGGGFDDGPLPPTDTLMDFLIQNNATATHFMIGVNILNNPFQFLKVFNAGHDIAVHTWTHPYMTTLTNEEVVSELGYTMEIIRNSTGGRVPKYWRPPFGDSDNRVNAIAREVFGLTTIIWNQDTGDWSIDQPGSTITIQSSEAALAGWLKGPKSPGLIVLEHELRPETVQVFMDSYPLIKQNGWTYTSVTQLFADNTPYQNAVSSSTGAVTPDDILANDQSGMSSSSNSASPSSASTSSAAGSSPSTAAGSPPSTASGSAPSKSNTPNSVSKTHIGICTTIALSLFTAIVHFL